MALFTGLDTSTRAKLDARVLAIYDAAVAAGDDALIANADAIREYLYSPDAESQSATTLVRTFELLAAQRLNRTAPVTTTPSVPRPPTYTRSPASAPLAPPPPAPVVAAFPLWPWLAGALGIAALWYFVQGRR